MLMKMKKLGPRTMLVEMKNGTAALEESLAVRQNVKCRFILFLIIPKINENIFTQKLRHICS